MSDADAWWVLFAWWVVVAIIAAALLWYSRSE